MFEIGDIVTVNFKQTPCPPDLSNQSRGKIVKIDSSSAAIEFDEKTKCGHDCGGYATYGYGYWVYISELVLYDVSPVVIIDETDIL